MRRGSLLDKEYLSITPLSKSKLIKSLVVLYASLWSSLEGIDSSMASNSLNLSSIFIPSRNPNPLWSCRVGKNVVLRFASKPSFRISANSSPKARFVAERSETLAVQQLERPLIEYMSLPASQYSVLDAERIERVDDTTFRCYVYTFKFFAFEVCPVLLVRVEEQLNGCCIRLLSCKLEGSPLVVAQNEKFSASMVNQISCGDDQGSASVQHLTSDTQIEVTIDIPFAFRAIPVLAIESSGRQVLEQILKIMLPRFMAQLAKDYQAWATGDTSRQPLGRGEI